MKYKTDETKGEYKLGASVEEESVENAAAMMGWTEPSVVIERPRVIAEKMPNGEFVERKIPAYVKYSTAFKSELKNISGSALKVWSYIILSIDEDGIAFPGIRTIAEDVGLSHQTVITAIGELEKLNLLHVLRGPKRYNIYHPSDEYVAIFDKNPMSQKNGTVKKMSQISKPDESSWLDLNKTFNKTKNEEEETATSKRIAVLKGLYEGNIGMPTPLLMGMLEKAAITYPEEWYQPAFEVMLKSAKHRSWAFVEAVLEGWKDNGFGWKPSSKSTRANGNGSKPAETEAERIDRILGVTR